MFDERSLKGLSSSLRSLLDAKGVTSLTAGASKKLTVKEVDAMQAEANITDTTERMANKMRLEAAGLMA